MSTSNNGDIPVHSTWWFHYQQVTVNIVKAENDGKRGPVFISGFFPITHSCVDTIYCSCAPWVWWKWRPVTPDGSYGHSLTNRTGSGSRKPISQLCWWLRKHLASMIVSCHCYSKARGSLFAENTRTWKRPHFMLRQPEFWTWYFLLNSATLVFAY